MADSYWLSAACTSAWADFSRGLLSITPWRAAIRSAGISPLMVTGVTNSSAGTPTAL
ncbi:hypothetical protein D3C81_2228680 [compost metagenome]